MEDYCFSISYEPDELNEYGDIEVPDDEFYPTEGNDCFPIPDEPDELNEYVHSEVHDDEFYASEGNGCLPIPDEPDELNEYGHMEVPDDEFYPTEGNDCFHIPDEPDELNEYVHSEAPDEEFYATEGDDWGYIPNEPDELNEYGHNDVPGDEVYPEGCDWGRIPDEPDELNEYGHNDVPDDEFINPEVGDWGHIPDVPDELNEYGHNDVPDDELYATKENDCFPIPSDNGNCDKDVPKLAEHNHNVLEDNLGIHELCECAVCLDIVSHPKTLQCEHTFCKDCIEELVECNENNTHSIKCPLCNLTHCIGKGSTLYDLKASLLLKQLLDKLQGGQKYLQKKMKVCCNVPISYYCGTCDLYICKKCMIRHAKNGCVGSTEVSFSKSKDAMVPYCSEHKSMKYSTCISCAEVTCPYCKGRNHHGHHVVSLNEYTLIFKGYLTAKIKTCQEYVDNAKERIITNEELKIYENAIQCAKALEGKGNVEVIWHTKKVLDMMSEVFCQ